MEVLLHFHMTICEEYEVIYMQNIELPYLMPYWRAIESLTHFTLNNWLRYEHSERQDIFSPHPVFCCSLSLFESIYKQLFFHTVTSKKSWFIFLPCKKNQGNKVSSHLNSVCSGTYCTSPISKVQIRIYQTSLGNFCWQHLTWPFNPVSVFHYSTQIMGCRKNCL